MVRVADWAPADAPAPDEEPATPSVASDIPLLHDRNPRTQRRILRRQLRIPSHARRALHFDNRTPPPQASDPSTQSQARPNPKHPVHV